MLIFSFIFFLLIFVLVGLASAFKRQDTTKDYFLSGQNVPGWLAGLSAAATNNSGFMFTGLIGYTYLVGLSSIWFMIAWVLGDYFSSLRVYKQMRVVAEKREALSYGDVLSGWSGKDMPYVRYLAVILVLMFLGTYAAAQFAAGSKVLHVLFDWPKSIGAIIGAAIVLGYCWVGGLRASIWTDAAQSVVMLIGMILMAALTVHSVGGVQAFITHLDGIAPDYLSLFPQDFVFGSWAGPVLFIMGWAFGGWGIVGQPHIIIRVLTLRSPDSLRSYRAVYYSFWSFMLFLGLIAGCAARLLIPEIQNFDSELALPMLAKELLPEILVGFVLAALFAATMSTADSQILSCSAALTNDLRITRGRYWLTKAGTVVITVIALSITLFGSDNIFQLVLVAWSALASAFAPLITVYAFGAKPSQKTAVFMIVAGLLGMWLWRAAGLQDDVYEAMPGMLAGFAVFAIAVLLNTGLKRSYTH